MRIAVIAAALALTLMLMAIGVSRPLERTVDDIRDHINSKPASGNIVLVEIDARSIQEIDSWPWPRGVHAELVDRLHEAGAEQIVFDVDFSSHSVAAEDQAFADAIARANGKVVLPTFRQPASAADPDAELENLPIDVLREQAFLGSVNVHPDISGAVNTYPYGTITAGIPRPSLGALLADASGPVDAIFQLDHSIEIHTIPTLSFIDVVDGRFDAQTVAGKRVIIGATAIELGDRYSTARFGVVPGVLIQALAAETLLAGMAMPQLGPAPLGLLAVLGILIYQRTRARKVFGDEAVAIALVLAAFAIAVLSTRMGWGELDVAPAIIFLGIWIGSRRFLGMLDRLDQERYFDRETGQPNLAAWRRQKGGGEPVIVIVADIANFGEILSTLGEADSAEFISAVADRLRLVAGEDSLHRIGRNQFCWSLGASNREDADQIAHSTGQLFNSPLLAKGRPIRASVCFGLVSGPNADPQGLSNKAVLAAQRAGAMGLRSLWHDDSLAQDADQSLFILSEFENALKRGEFSVVFQPKFSVEANRVTGAEALVRWTSAVRGQMSPAVFIPVLERENLIGPLTLFVLRDAIANLNLWNEQARVMSCAVNVSAALLGQSRFMDEALAIIESECRDASLLTFELTETAVLSTPDEAAAQLTRFAALGVRLSIDDFGTGQSTLSYLKHFSAAEIKIDQSFISVMASSNANRIMVRSTIEMAHALGLSVVGEGAEDEVSFNMLKEFGCDTVQGWYIGRPLRPDEFALRWLGPARSEEEMSRETTLKAG